VKLLDFGLAKLSEPGGPSTAPGVALGTPEYMSPEQMRASAVDARADVYSVGVITFQMLTGRRPYSAASAQDVVDRVLDGPVPRVSSVQPRVHPRFDELVFRMMKKRAQERPASVEEVQLELAAIKRVLEADEAGGQGATDPAMAPTEVVSALERELGLPDDDEAPPKKKRRWPLWVAAAVLGLGASGAGVWWLLNPP
jgi:serine/threonine-protein kinase